MFIKKFNFYRVLQSDLQLEKSTVSGGILSIITLILIGFFTLYEIGFHLTNRIEKHISITNKEELLNQLDFNFDITFPHMPCHAMAIYKNDQVESSFYGIYDGIDLERLNKAQEHIPNDYYDSAIKLNHSEFNIEELKFFTEIQDFEGCRMNGTVIVNKVEGGLNIGINKLSIPNEVWGHVKGFTISKYNYMHTINHLSFGSKRIQHKIINKFEDPRLTEFDKSDMIKSVINPHSDNYSNCLYFMHVLPHYFIDADVFEEYDDSYIYSITGKCYVN